MRNSCRHPRSGSSASVMGSFLLIAILLNITILTTSFTPSAACTAPRRLVILQDSSGKSYDPEDEVNLRLAKARAVLAKSKAKLETQEASSKNKQEAMEPESPLPFFFAAKAKPKLNPKRREQLSKAFNEMTGLVQADGDKMAEMSEKEEWEYRTLLEVFENEINENEDVYSEANQQLAQRDVAASIWNLKKSMRTEDYQRIFDKRNRFIGEDM